MLLMQFLLVIELNFFQCIEKLISVEDIEKSLRNFT